MIDLQAKAPPGFLDAARHATQIRAGWDRNKLLGWDKTHSAEHHLGTITMPLPDGRNHITMSKDRMNLAYRPSYSEEPARILEELFHRMKKANAPEYARRERMPMDESIRVEWRAFIITMNDYEAIFDAEWFVPADDPERDNSWRSLHPEDWKNPEREDSGDITRYQMQPYQRQALGLMGFYNANCTV